MKIKVFMKAMAVMLTLAMFGVMIMGVDYFENQALAMSHDNAPTVLPTAGSFTDTDDTADKIGGTIAWTAADPATDITGYHIYWGSNAATKLAGNDTVVYTVVDASSTSQVVAADTDLPAGASHFLIYSYNAVGDSANCLGVPISDTLSYPDANGNTYAYIDNGDGTVTITGFTRGISTDVEIPGTINGKDVTHIGNTAFSNKGLTSVTIPNSVTNIGAEAFSWNQLVNVTIPDSVTGIEKQAFEYNHDTLVSVTLGSGLVNIGEKAFFNDKLESIIIPDNVESIGVSAFGGSTNNITSITLGSGLENIGKTAFQQHKTKHIVIPANVTNIGSQAFNSIEYQQADLIIYGYASTNAQSYAAVNSHTFVMPSGEGTQGNPYLIASAYDLVWMSIFYADDNGFENKYFEQIEDIDMSSIDNFTPIGNNDCKFEGSFDGKDYIISNLTMDFEGMESVGLFGVIDENGLVQCVTLEDVSIQSQNKTAVVGGIAGKNAGSIVDCQITASSIGQSLIAGIGENFVAAGGIVGINNNASVSLCSNTAQVQVSNATANPVNLYLAGGISAYNLGAIDYCFNTGSIVAADYDADEIALGGIAGQNEGSVNYCFSNGAITMESPDSDHLKGGIAGFSHNMDLSSNFYLDDTAQFGIGGAGKTGPSSEGAEAKTDSQLKDPATFADWDTDNCRLVADYLPVLKGVYRRYMVAYNGNENSAGTAPVDIKIYAPGKTVKALGNPGNLTRSGYTWSSWNTAADGSGTDYSENDSFTMGNADVTLSAKWTAVSSGGGKSPSNNVPVTVDGQTQQQGATIANSNQNGHKVSTVTLDTQKMTGIVNSSQSGSTVAVPMTNSAAQVLIAQLTGELVKNMENQQSIVEIHTDSAIYPLPAQQINIDAVSAQFGQDLNLSDIKIDIEIANTPAAMVGVVENSAELGTFSIVVPPLDFSIKATYGDKTVEINKFNAYVERLVAIPDGVDPSLITTAIIVEPDGAVRHVPTQVIIIDGKQYARINSLTNSTYTVISNPLEFTDAANHWAKDAINDMGSRMIISGVGDGIFEPDRDITRAEFAAIIVRALGLQPGMGANPFTDVKDSDWYRGFVSTAVDYKLISGYGNGKFGPSDKITREQAMTMIGRAMTITGLKVELSADTVNTILTGFQDANQSADYARNSIAACIEANIISGRNGNQIASQDNITRAEVALIVKRLLQNSNLI